MSVVRRAWSILIVAAKRILSQRWLALATALGLVAAVALTVSVPLYADAVYYRVFRQKLVTGRSGNRPPFALMFRYIGAWAGSVEWEDAQPVDEYLSERAVPALGLPRRFMVRYLETDNFKLFPREEAAYADVKDPLTWVDLAFGSDMRDHITIVEGSFPAAAAPSSDSTVEVLASEALATELGLQVGESYILFATRRTEEGQRTTQIPARITGVWRPADAQDEYWFYDPRALEETLLVPEETFLGRISPYVEDEIYTALWYMVLDGSDVHASDVDSLLARITAVRQRASSLLPQTRLDVSPVSALHQYRRAAGLLTLLLYAFSIPIAVLILAFIGLVVGLSVDRQRNEIAVLRSRGATATQVTGIAALEGVLLGLLALAIGLPIGERITYLIGRARSFLDFTLHTDLRVSVTGITARFGVVAVGLALLARMVPTVGAARHTIVTYKRGQARSRERPWWQRAWLDVLLLIPAAYGVYVLRQQGSIALSLTGESTIGDPFQNPLLLLVPALGLFALTLLILRVLPLLMAGVAWIASRLDGIGVLIAARHLSRTPGFYAAPLLLLVLTLSLSAFTASLAQTLDNHLYDRMYYETGADMELIESGESTESPVGGGGPFGGGGEEGGADEEEEGPRWLFLPVSEHLKVPGVEAAARVGRYEAATSLSGGRQNGVFMGVDRVDFSKVAFWRSDFAPANLGTLMNALAVRSEGVLVPRGFMARHALNVGDTFRVTVRTYGEAHELDLKIVGGFDLFPGWYPEEGPLFVGNLDYLFQQAGGQFPYDVWLRTGTKMGYERVVEGVRDLGLRVLNWKAPRLEIIEEQRQPERQGLFGVLSVGFLATAVLTVVGFLLYAIFSFRRRFIELGVLRAIGLSSGQMTAFLAWELVFLILTGLGGGTGLGIWVSDLFIPYLQVGTEASARTPPFVVEIAWPAILRIYVLFGLLFGAALLGLVVLLRRMEIFRAIKMGEMM